MAFTILSVNILLVSISATHANAKIQLFTGFTITNLSNIYLYDASIPLIYTLPFGAFHNFEDIPDFHKQIPCPFPDNNLNTNINPTSDQNPKFGKTFIPLRLVRDSINMRTASPTIPVACTAYNQINDVFNATITILRAGIDSTSSHDDLRQKRALDFIGDFLKFCCGAATQNELSSMYRNEKFLTTSYNDIRKLVHHDHDDLITSTRVINEMSKDVESVLTDAESQIQHLAEEVQLTENLETQKLLGLLHLAARQARHTYFNTYYTHMTAVKASCEAHCLPSELISKTLLKNDLQTLFQKLAKHDKILAIPLRHLHLYYSQPITTCVFSETSIIITIQVPLQSKEAHFNLFKITTVPLLWEDTVCTLPSPPSYLARSPNFVQSIPASDTCDLHRHKICYLPRFQQHSGLHAKCAQSIINSTPLEEIIKHCNFQCHTRSTETYITEVTPSRYYITNVQPQTHLVCSTQTTQLPSQTPGALDIQIPCDCELIHEGNKLIRKTTPCDSRFPNTPTYTHLIPTPWTNVTLLNNSDPNTSYFPFTANLQSIINHKWNLSFPHAKIPDNFQSTNFQEGTLPKTWTEIINADSFSKWIVYTSIVILFLAQCYIAYKIKILYVKLSQLTRRETFQLRQID